MAGENCIWPGARVEDRQSRRRPVGALARTMLERVLPAQAGADVDIEFDPAGLHFEMEAPLIEHRLVPEY